jgi:hypothetical protein
MSVSFSAYIVFGVRIKYEKLFQSGEQRGCDHETRDFQFCPECGEQMWKSTTNKVELNPDKFKSLKPHHIGPEGILCDDLETFIKWEMFSK